MKMRSKALERLSRALITLLGAGLGAALAMLLTPLLRRVSPQIFEQFSNQVLLYVVLCLLGALIFFALSMSILTRCMKAAAVIEQHWEKMPNRQIVWTSLGLLCGLAIAALFTQLILSAGASLLTLSFSALTYIFLGYLGLQIGNHRYHSGICPPCAAASVTRTGMNPCWKPFCPRFRKTGMKARTSCPPGRSPCPARCWIPPSSSTAEFWTC